MSRNLLEIAPKLTDREWYIVTACAIVWCDPALLDDHLPRHSRDFVDFKRRFPIEKLLLLNRDELIKGLLSRIGNRPEPTERTLLAKLNGLECPAKN